MQYLILVWVLSPKRGGGGAQPIKNITGSTKKTTTWNIKSKLALKVSSVLNLQLATILSLWSFRKKISP